MPAKRTTDVEGQSPAEPWKWWSSGPVICLLLAIVTLATWWPVVYCQFLDYDDQGYFWENPHVLTGLSWANVIWAFKTTFATNWHPLTWLSLMLDADLFGKGPIGPHFTNLLIHTANSMLLFVLMRRLTNKTWPSALVAALFALHPLHVESVAWVAERKDVLSAFFGLLSLWAYAAYARKSAVRAPGCRAFYSLALIFFAFGLMSKPMLVTLPLVMLLLDFWPLQRFNASTLQRLLLEKIPFFALTAMVSVVTFVVQQQGGAVVALARYSVSVRIENALVSYARYLGKALWPATLATPYPHPESWPLPVWLLALVLFAGLSLAAIGLRKKFPCAITGWFWFVIMLVPVIGLVQVGGQAMADRYAYLPLVGLLIIFSWGLAGVQARWPQFTRELVLLAAVLVLAGALRTRDQIRYWKNDGSLFLHALQTTKNNYTACVNLGTWFSKNGQHQEALDCYQMALRMNPSDPSVLYDLANAFARMGHWEDAVKSYRRALAVGPPQADILDNLGFALVALKQYDEAVTNFATALKLKPDSLSAQNNLAYVLFLEHRYAEAAEHYRAALRQAPDDPRIHANLGDALSKLGQISQARQCYQDALRLDPDNASIRAKLQALEGAAPK